MRSRSDTRQGGFTLVELLVVLAILALAYALAVPSMSTAVGGARRDAEARALVAALREARSTALVTGREVRFTLDPADRSWRFGDRRGRIDEQLRLTLELPPGGRDDAGRPFIAFFPEGGSTGGRMALADAGGSAQIQVNWLTGRVGLAR